MPVENSSSPVETSTFIQFAVAIVTALASVIVYFWRSITKNHEDQQAATAADRAATQEKLDKCEEEHKKTQGELNVVSGRLERLEGKMEGLMAGGGGAVAELLSQIDDGRKRRRLPTRHDPDDPLEDSQLDGAG